jgi:hypothetical protein
MTKDKYYTWVAMGSSSIGWLHEDPECKQLPSPDLQARHRLQSPIEISGPVVHLLNKCTSCCFSEGYYKNKPILPIVEPTKTIWGTAPEPTYPTEYTL